MSNFERKFGKYALSNLPMIMIFCYLAGYVISLINVNWLLFLTLDPYQILHGQVWRLVTWLLVPPTIFGSSAGLMDWFLTAVMLYFYYSVGTMMERTMGAYRFNVYIFRGILFTIVAAFLAFGIIVLEEGFLQSSGQLSQMSGQLRESFLASASLGGSLSFSTYYINMSIFLAFAATYPNLQVLLMFVIPVKVKWMGILYLVMLVYSMFTGGAFAMFAIGASLVNFLIFFLQSRNLSHLRPGQVQRRAQFRQQVHRAQPQNIHKCAICGQTSESNPNLEFRYCSRCNGSYEYCQEHLFTHSHVR